LEDAGLRALLELRFVLTFETTGFFLEALKEELVATTFFLGYTTLTSFS